jgi:hypothetical protein
MKYIRRILALPFFMVFTMMHWITLWIYSLWLFLKYGGEWVQFDRDSIRRIFREGIKETVPNESRSFPGHRNPPPPPDPANDGCMNLQIKRKNEKRN